MKRRPPVCEGTLAAFALDGFEYVSLSMQGGDFYRHHADPVVSCLAAKTQQQFFTPDPAGEAGAIVTGRDKRCAAAAAVHYQDLAPVAGKINRRRQAGRSSADDQAVMAIIGGIHARRKVLPWYG